MNNETVAQPVENTNWYKTNQGLGLILCGLFGILLLYIIFMTDAFRPLRDGFLLGFFPMAATILCTLFSVMLMTDHLRKFTEPDFAALDFKFFGFVVAAIAWSGIFFWFLVEIGFIVSGPIYMFGLIYTLGLRPARTAFIAGLSICAAVFIIFAIIGAPIPIGPEWLMEKWGLPVY